MMQIIKQWIWFVGDQDAAEYLGEKEQWTAIIDGEQMTKTSATAVAIAQKEIKRASSNFF